MIRFERRLAHPVTEVWAAITEPARLAEWWLPFDADITVDLRPGGLMVMAATGDEPVTMTCEILRVEPPVLLEHTHVDPGSRVRWELEPDGDGCVLRLSHFVTDPATRDRQLLRRRPPHVARPARTVPRRRTDAVGLGRLRPPPTPLRRGRARPCAPGRRVARIPNGARPPSHQGAIACPRRARSSSSAV